MSYKFLVTVVLGVLILTGAGCVPGEEVPANENGNQDAGQSLGENANTNSEEVIAPSDEEGLPEIEGVSFVDYTNKSLGYKISRPDHWYWRHYNKRELAESMPEVEDLFITDPQPLLSNFESQYLGRIVIEVSKRSLESIASNYSDLTSSEATIDGVTANKYEGIRNNEVVENQTIIVYAFQNEGKTYKIVYVKNNSNDVDKAVFQRVVDSFRFK